MGPDITIEAPAEVRAGEPFQATLTAHKAGRLRLTARTGDVEESVEVVVGPPHIAVPESIPADGSRDVSSELLAWLRNEVPDGAVVHFAESGQYLHEQPFGALMGRRGITIEGHGATLRVATMGDDIPSPDQRDADPLMRDLFHAHGGNWFAEWPRKRMHVCLIDCEDITVRGLNVRGVNERFERGGEEVWGRYSSRYEGQHAYRVENAHRTRLERVGAYDVSGDFLAVFGDTADTLVERPDFRWCGRQGISVTNGSDTVVRGPGYIGECGRSIIDIEPNFPHESGDGFTLEGMEVGAYMGVWFTAGGNGPARNIVLRNNRLLHRMEVRVKSRQPIRRGPIFIEGNVAAKPYGSPAAAFVMEHTDGVMIRGNSCPIVTTQSRKAVELCGCTGFDRAEIEGSNVWAPVTPPGRPELPLVVLTESTGC